MAEKNKNERLETEIKEMINELEKGFTVSKLAKERDDLYEQFTNEMLLHLKPVFKAAETFLDKDIAKITKWRAVELLDNDTKIMVLGSVTFPIGSNVMIDENGLSIEVTKENQDSLQRIMRIVVPTELAEEGDVSKIESFFKDNYNLDVMPTTIHNPMEDFSIEDLTKEQIEKMMMFDHQKKYKIN